MATDSSEPLLRIEELTTHFFVDEGVVKSVDGVDLTVPAGKTVCVVGESGCGKSVTARSILNVVDPPGRIVSGKVIWNSPSHAGPSANGRAHDRGVDLAALPPAGEEMRSIRGREIAMVFQEPMASLSPMYTVAEHLIEALQLHQKISKKEARDVATDLLRRVGIPHPERRLDVYPFQLSGGMCQRVMIAIALSCNPSLLIADEPTTALDVTSQARILELLTRLQKETGMAMLFITHDLGVVAEIADEVAVMYLGRVVEQGPVRAIFHNPQHPYTKALLASIPRMGRGARQRLSAIRGQVPSPLAPPPGCSFHPRCDSAIDGVCNVEQPAVVTAGDSTVRCVLPVLKQMEVAR